MTGELEPRHVAAVDQGEALVADALSTYADNYRELQARVGDTKALLTLAAQISADAHRGSRGMDGLASLAAVAIAQLAAATRPMPVGFLPGDEGHTLRMNDAPARTLPCGCGYNAAGAQCAIGVGCHGNHTSATVEAHAAEQVEPWHGKAAQSGSGATMRIGSPRCSRCYGVGHYASECTVGL